MTDVKRPISLQLSSLPSVRSSSPQPCSSSSTTKTTNTRPRSFAASRAPTKKFCDHQNNGCTSATYCSRTSSSNSSGYDSPHSPSLILPYLYVGDEAQTQIDTISNLNIRYILSLQSLPKFLDDTAATAEDYGVHSPSSPSRDKTKVSAQFDHHVSTKPSIEIGERVQLATEAQTSHELQVETMQITNAPSTSSVPMEVVRDNNSLVHTSAESSTGFELEQHDDGDSSVSDKALSTKTVSKHLPNKKDLLPQANSSKDYLVKFKSCVNKLIRGKCINISDTFETLVDKFFDETHNFIEEARRNRCNVLVHCKAGISRSPTIAIAYLMKWKRLHLQDAYDFVKRCRPQISPNLSFMGQLMSYERKLLQRDHFFYKCSRLPSPTSCCLSSTAIPQDQTAAVTVLTLEPEPPGAISCSSSSSLDGEAATEQQVSTTATKICHDLKGLSEKHLNQRRGTVD